MTCCWQYPDRLHFDPATPTPPTSILWGWWPVGDLVRVRLDGATAHLTTRPPRRRARQRLLRWAAGDQRLGTVDRPHARRWLDDRWRRPTMHKAPARR